MANPVLSSIYDGLFHCCSSDIVESAASQLLLVTNHKQYENDSQSLLLWLSIIKKIFMSGEVMTVEENVEETRSTVMGSILDSLLQTPSFIPFIITCIAHEDQHVSYLASRVLPMGILASQSIKEEEMQMVYTYSSLSNHEPNYSIEVLKQLLKTARKTQKSLSFTKAVYSSISSHWKEYFTDLAKKLDESRALSKWPELNILAFLSMSAEVLRHPLVGNGAADSERTYSVQDCHHMIIENLVDLTIIVTTRCTSPVALKELLKIFCRITDKAKVSILMESETDFFKKQLEQCLSLLLESSSLVEIVSSILEKMRSDWYDDATSEMDGVNRTIARKGIVFLMKYGTIFTEQSEIIHFERDLSTFSHQCSSSSVPGNMQWLRHTVFQLLNEQDDSILDALFYSCDLWKKRDAWDLYPTLRFCFSALELHSLILNFMLSVTYDHSILLDFIVSPESPEFVKFLIEYLKVCIVGWSELCAACEEMDGYLQDQVCLSAMELSSHSAASKELSSEDNTLPLDPGSESATESVTSEEYYSETTLDKIMDCFTRLKYTLVKLSASNLIPLSVDKLVSALNQVEDLYGCMGDN